MTSFNRRSFLKVLGAAGAASIASSPVLRAFADPSQAVDDYFLFVHAQGAWDVMLSLDPRNESAGIIDPPSDANVDIAGITHWTPGGPTADGGTGFALVKEGNLVFGPAIGGMRRHASRMTVFNGLAMNTVSHFDGSAFAVTGRHLAGGKAAQSSVDTMLANELGVQQPLPLVSIRFPSSYIGSGLDPRAIPLRIGAIDSVGGALTRSAKYESEAARDAVSVMLTDEVKDLVEVAHDKSAFEAMGVQIEALRGLHAKKLGTTFNAQLLMKNYETQFGFSKLRFMDEGATSAAFAIEALKQNIGRCVSFRFGSFDTHYANYADHPRLQQETFDTLAALIDILDATPHPTKIGKKLADHTHILVVSDFCRTPGINLQGGRDHYPNGSAVVISPAFKGGVSFGGSDEQLLPKPAGDFADGTRAVAPPDVLATFLAGVGADPRKYLRDGEIIKSLLRSA